MANKVLIFLWIIIIGGALFIGSHYIKPKKTEIGRTPTPLQTEVINETEVIESGEKTYNQYLAQGDQHLQKGEAEAAILNYKNATKLAPTSAEPLVRLGQAYLFNDEPKEAETIFQQASTIEPDSTEIKLRIAQSLLDQREIQQAKAMIWQLNESDSEVQYYKGIIEVLYKNFDEAKEIFTRLVEKEEEIEPIIKENSKTFSKAYAVFAYYKEGEQPFLQTLLAKALTDTGQYQATIPLIFDVLNSKKNYRDAWIILGYAYLNTNQISPAIDAFTKAQALDTENPETMFFLGLAHFADNNIDKAILAIEKADELGYTPKDQIKLKLGDLYLLKEEYEKAENSYDEVISLNPSNIDVFTRNVWLNIDKLDRQMDAVEVAYKAMENLPDNAMSYNLVGWALTANGNYDDAEDYLKKALSMKPNFDAAFLNMGWLYEKQNATTLAKEYYKKAYDLGGQNSIANLAAIRFNNISKPELKNQYKQVNISAP